MKPEEINAIAARRVEEVYALLRQRLSWHPRVGALSELPRLSFDVSGSCGGKAKYRPNLIEINPVLMERNLDDYVKETIPHEAAHLAAFRLFGPKVQAHGFEWGFLMLTLGLDPTRCHSYDTRGVGRDSTLKWRMEQYE